MRWWNFKCNSTDMDFSVYDAVHIVAFGLNGLNPTTYVKYTGDTYRPLFAIAMKEIERSAREGKIEISGVRKKSTEREKIPGDYWDNHCFEDLSLYDEDWENLRTKAKQPDDKAVVYNKLRTNKAKIYYYWHAGLHGGQVEV